jgi:hypothetical protein
MLTEYRSHPIDLDVAGSTKRAGFLVTNEDASQVGVMPEHELLLCPIATSATTLTSGKDFPRYFKAVLVEVCVGDQWPRFNEVGFEVLQDLVRPELPIRRSWQLTHQVQYLVRIIVACCNKRLQHVDMGFHLVSLEHRQPLDLTGIDDYLSQHESLGVSGLTHVFVDGFGDYLVELWL